MTHKAIPIYHYGHKVVQLSDLPTDQGHLFSGWISPSSFVQLKETPDRDWVHYDDYDYWYQNHFLVQQDLDVLI